MNRDEAKAYCARWLPAWTGNRPEELLFFYAPDALYRDPAYPKGLQGHRQMDPYFRKLLAKYPDWVWEALEILPTDDGFVLKWRARLSPNSSEAYEEGLDIVEIRNGLIQRNEVYFDPSRWLSADRTSPGSRPGPPR